ncbi:hypothetical protein BZG36_03607 [Bifiguratus adelaidae]|uniref:AB hydrolase-1 domain-containing protein n=1 Tax=Bifiguratus adelaidae TaxID=1938954 RepID=A0A261XZY3_9FUNG|nr:hypothetical protein BZG36_03607 [Bifiguratus adelaidae]
MSSQHMVNDLEQLRIHLNIPSLTLIGHSHGGLIALGYAQQFPTRVSKLALLANQLMGFRDSKAFARFAVARKDDSIYGPALLAMQKWMSSKPETDEDFGSLLTKALPFYFADPTKAAVLVEAMTEFPIAWAWCTSGPADQAAPTNQVESLSKIQARTLIIFGSEDAISPVSIGQRTRDGIASSQLIVYEQCGHFPWIERPNEFFAYVIHFLQQVSAKI